MNYKDEIIKYLYVNNKNEKYNLQKGKPLDIWQKHQQYNRFRLKEY